MFYYYLLLLCAGFVAGILLFSKRAALPALSATPAPVKVSVIIPARNEENNIAHLLRDLQRQTLAPFEVLCVDDGSTDNTATVIHEYGVGYLQVHNKPDNWTGKTFACQTGANAAAGDVFIFIDADVRLAPEALEKIAANPGEAVVSVQPFHLVQKPFEQFAFFFNAMGLGANGVFCRFSARKAGLFGPVICISKPHFEAIGGFSKVSTSIIEDVALGKVLEKQGIPVVLFAGDPTVSFRMYHSFRDLIIGFTKNYSSGAAQTPLLLLMLSFLWITALTTVPLLVVQGLLLHHFQLACLGILFYFSFTFQLLAITKRTGTFHRIYIVAYPVLLAVFHFVFLYSLYARVVLKKVSWKGRDISLKK